MMVFKGIVLTALLPVWAAVTVLLVAAVSLVEGPPLDVQLRRLGLRSTEAGAFETIGGAVIIGVVVIHLLASVVTSRAVAAMAGSVGGLIGAVVAGLGAVALAVAPAGDRVDALRDMTQPVAVVGLGLLSAALGFRAYLAHMGRWRYAKQSPHHSWDDGGGFD